MDTQIRVFVSNRATQCEECAEPLGKGNLIMLRTDRKPVCLVCADLDHLVFLPAGDTALTSRARKQSTLFAVVLRWSQTRKRNERQGILVEQQALETAERECLEDSEARARKRLRDAERRGKLDLEYLESFADRIRDLYPGCPAGVEREIAEHACLKYSGRVGRTAAAKSLDAYAVTLAVRAHIRHAETNYDELLTEGYDRQDAREIVNDKIDEIRANWRQSKP
jgi:hypothetical protein